VGRREAREPALRLLELSRAADEVPAAVLVPRDDDVDEALEEVAFVLSGLAPRLFERFVRLEIAARPRELEPSLEGGLDCHARQCYPHGAVATILLCGVDLFFRGKLDALLPGHHLITAESVDPPDLVIADIARIDAEEVADAYPDVPIVGFTNHADTAGLRAAHAAGFDQVLAKSALVERVGEVVDELLGTPS
jgi:CheY-like chemotaxis protein